MQVETFQFFHFPMALDHWMIPWCKVEALHLNLSNCTELQDLGTEKESRLQCFYPPIKHGRKCTKTYTGLHDLKWVLPAALCRSESLGGGASELEQFLGNVLK